MKKLALAVIALVATVTAPAFAGERTNLSALPILPLPKDATSPPMLYGVPGITMKEHATPHTTFYDLTAASAQGYCFVARNEVFQLESETSDDTVDEMWRLTEKDGTATLERVKYQIAPYLGNVWAKSRASVALKELATDYGVTAWGLREPNGDVVVIAKRASGGRQAVVADPEKNMFPMVSSTCTYGATRISAGSIKKGGGAAQLNGVLPAVGEGKDRVESPFTIDISAVKVARDPEPVISVRIRKGGASA